MRRRFFVASLLLVTTTSLKAATSFREIDVRIVPPQPVNAVSIASGDDTRSIAVRNGKALIPADFPPPWSLRQLRFEADTYTSADVDAKRPWLIRELGIVRGRLQKRSSATDERFTWVFADAKSNEVRDIDFALDTTDSFAVRVAAGMYHGAVLGPGCGTRIRSGIIVRPGETTDVGALAPEPAVPVSVRVLDAGGRDGVAGARLIWDPAGDMLNSELSRRLYGRRWSAVTDRRGMAEIRFVGPVPHSARWRIEAAGFAPTRTADALLTEPVRFAMPDVRMRPEPLVTIHVSFPRFDRDELDGARLVAGEIRDSRSRDFVPVQQVPLREGDVAFRFKSYGLKRVWVESAGGRRLTFKTIEARSPASIVDLDLHPVEITGHVTYRDKAIADALVSLADPLKGSEFLAQVPSDQDGRFRIRTWATGEMLLYTIPSRSRTGPGKSFGNASEKIDLTDRSELSVDLAIPSSGFSLAFVDADTNAPVRARFETRSRHAERTRYGWNETDAQGKFDLSGYPEGTATLYVIAKGYRSEKIDIPINADHPENTIRLQRAKPSSLRVVDLRGMPIRGATVVGGFENENEDPFHSATTDANGRVEFDPPPALGTMFYVAAGGYALGMTMLEPEREVTIALQPPSSSIVTLRQKNAPPDKVFLVMAAPAGREFIPLNAIEELAEANGMNLYQISGSSPAGDVVLPEFLGPGTWDLFLARRGGKPFLYEKFATIRTPLTRNAFVSIEEQ